MAAASSGGLWKKVLVGLVLGVIVGIPATFKADSTLGFLAPSDEAGCLWVDKNAGRDGIYIEGHYNKNYPKDEIISGLLTPLRESMRAVATVTAVKGDFVEKSDDKFYAVVKFPKEFNEVEALAAVKASYAQSPIKREMLAEKTDPVKFTADKYYSCRAFYKDATVYLKQLGVIFMNLVMMIVVPLIFFSLVSGINSMNDSKTMGRVGKKATIVYMITSMAAVGLGVFIGLWFQPGVGVDLHAITSGGKPGGKDLPKLMEVVLDMIPHNALGAMAGADGKPSTIQTVVFAIFVGVTLNLMGDKGRKLVDICHAGAQLMFKMIGFIIKLSPYAVFGLMAWVSANLGMDAIIQLGYFVVSTITGMGLHYIILGGMIIVMARISPIPFYKKSFEYQALAFSTSSSKATLATSMQVAEEKMGISKGITSFVLPLGAAINMDGTAIYLGLTAVFFAQAYGIDLHTYQYIMIIFTSTIASIGAAGYPGGSLVMMSLVLESIGVPIGGIALLVGVDRILDMCRTTINITSDVAITLIVDKSENSLDLKRYNATGAELERQLAKI